MTDSIRTPVTVLTQPGQLLSWARGLPSAGSESWDDLDAATIRFNDGSSQMVAFPKNVAAVEFFSTLHCANGYNQSLHVTGMEMDR